MKPAHSILRHTLTAFGLIVGVIGTWLHTRVTDFPIDMVIYRKGVKAYLEGRSVYSEPMMAGDVALPFIYPPFGAFVMVPLTAFGWIDNDMAGNIMIVLSNILVLVCLYFVFQAILPKRDLLWPVAACVWALDMAIEPIRLNNDFAQINIVVMALVVLDLVPRRRWLPQGILIGLAAAIKITPLAILLYFLLRKEARPIFTALASAVVATVVAGLFRWQAFVEFFSTKLFALGSGSNVGVATEYQSNSSIKGALQRLFSSAESMEAQSTLLNVTWLVLSLVVIVCGSALILALLKRSMLVDAQLITALVMLLISPVSWSHHWVWLSLVLPVFIYRAWTWRHHTWVAGSLLTVLVAWLAMLVTVPPKWWFGDAINVFAMPFYQEFLVDDFVWLALISVALYAICLRTVPATAHSSSPASSRSTAM
ncbi:glycosyltransferase 87 family protein [Corynebacterium flavescens]|uniref:glycosyltransferase 87 family protein n=1 Tax=Corynebacterium flavescens TaxID=28028 RepID=UPI003FD1B2D2